MTRRQSLLALATPVAGGLGDPQPTPARKLNVVCVGGHPDDPESGCGGTLARYSALGHAVTIIYLTRGEAGIKGKTHDEAARIRTEEALKACRILGAKPVFAGQIDGSNEISNSRYQAFDSLLTEQQPDVVFTHWPVDTHRDHCAASLLAFQSWYRGGKKYALVYFEVMSGSRPSSSHRTSMLIYRTHGKRKKRPASRMRAKSPQNSMRITNRWSGSAVWNIVARRAEAFVVHSQGPLPPLAW